MPPRCRVTFFDTRHQIRRTLLIESALPLVAAEIAVARLANDHVLPEDLAPLVKVEIIRTTEQTVPLAAITGRIRRVA